MRSLMEMLFGPREKPNAAAAAIRKEQTLAAINEVETTADKPPVLHRTIGLTEQRLRARNKQSWMTSTRGWSDFFGRFTTSGR
ncbi:MAG TPA: hypothetical protein VHL32_08410 [Gemmatimonadaceae bacterium]|nr:hypothetical protein [Gemmatimonadaceae bacterium]